MKKMSFEIMSRTSAGFNDEFMNSFCKTLLWGSIAFTAISLGPFSLTIVAAAGGASAAGTFASAACA